MTRRATTFRFLACALALAGLAGCAGVPSGTSRGGKTPSWVEDKDSAYPPDRYLAEVGEGDGLRAAKADAAGAIAQIFRTRVQVDSTVATRYTEITGAKGETLGLANQTDVNETIGQTSDQTLFNLRYGESWTDGTGRTYAVAYLDRTETGNLYRSRIMENDQRTGELLNRARAQSEPLKRYAFLDAAAVMAEANGILLAQLEIINPAMARASQPANPLSDIRAARADQAAALKIQVEVSDDPDGSIRNLLADWASEKGFTVTPAGDMLLAGVYSLEPVQLNNGYENLSWLLSVSFLDSSGHPALAMEYKGRSSGVSASAAASRAYRDVAEAVSGGFEKEFQKYLDSFLEK